MKQTTLRLCAPPGALDLDAIVHTYKNLFSEVEDGFFIINPDLDVEFVNQKAAEISRLVTGFRLTAGQPLLASVPADRQEYFRGMLASVLEGNTVTYNRDVLQQDGRHCWLRFKYIPLTDNRQQVIGICGMMKNITALKNLQLAHQREKALAEQHLQSFRLFETFMHNSPIAGWICNAEGNLHYANPTYLKKHGFDETAIGKHLTALFPGALGEQYHQNNLRVITENAPKERLETYPATGGGEQVLKKYKFPLQIEGRTMVAGWGVDITEQLLLEKQLVESVERYAYVNEATSDGIYDYDIKEGKIYISSRFDEMFGYEEKEISIFENLNRIHPADRKRVKAIYVAALKSRSTERWSVEFRYRAANGSYKYVHDKALIKREANRPVRVIGAFQDVSEQKALQQKIKATEKTRKQEILRSVIDVQEKERQNLSTELHDNVNQILASCKLMLEVARDRPQMTTDMMGKALENLKTAMQEIRKITHNLNPAALDDVGLEEAIADMVGKINCTGKLQIGFTYQGCDKGLCLPPAYRIAVYRMVQEQLCNILKHAKATEATISLRVEDKLLQLVVTDNGVGFNLDKAKKGLGLKNIQNRVDIYGGRLTVVTAPGEGCCTTVVLKIG